MSSKSYCGVGSRSTPPDVMRDMAEFAALAAGRGWILRSGGAEGADSAFEAGCDIVNGEKEIYLPWKGYNSNPSMKYGVNDTASKIAATVHPYFERAKKPVQLLLSRNVYQVLGADVDSPVEFVLCYTADGCEHYTTYTPTKTGGTGVAIALASKLEIPVYNLYHQGRLEAALKHISGEE